MDSLQNQVKQAVFVSKYKAGTPIFHPVFSW